jgi:ribosome modulation factor
VNTERALKKPKSLKFVTSEMKSNGSDSHHSQITPNICFLSKIIKNIVHGRGIKNVTMNQGLQRGIVGPSKNNQGLQRGIVGPSKNNQGLQRGIVEPNKNNQGLQRGIVGPSKNNQGLQHGTVGPSKNNQGLQHGIVGPNKNNQEHKIQGEVRK